VSGWQRRVFSATSSRRSVGGIPGSSRPAGACGGAPRRWRGPEEVGADEMLSRHLGNVSLITSDRNGCQRWFRTAELLRVQKSPASCSRATERERDRGMMSGRFRWAVGVPWRARGAFYRPERGSGSVTGGGGPGSGAPVKARRGSFGDLLACAAIHCGVVMSVLASWTGQRRGKEMGRKERGPVAFILLSLGSHGWVRAGVRGRRQQDTLGEAGTLWEGQRGGWLLILVLTCTFAEFCPPCV
jgi:hypothetical protein